MPGMGFGFGFGFHRGASGSGASASEQLLTLATDDGWAAVYDPTNPDTRTLRNDGANDFISAIADGLGNLPDLEQGTAANQPQLVVGHFGQLDAGLYDGSTSYLTAAAFSAAHAQPNFQVALTEEDSGASGDSSLTNGSVAGNRNSMLVRDNGGTRELHMYAGSSASTTGLATGTGGNILGALFNGASSVGYRNSSAGAVGSNPGAEALDGLRVGANLGLTTFHEGEIGVVLLYDGDPGATKRQRMFDLLHDLTGIAKA